MQGERVGRTFDHLAEAYDESYRTKAHRAEDYVTFRLLTQVLPFFPKVLDLGCGTGLLLEYVYQQPNRYLGVDVSAKMLKRFRRKFPLHEVHQLDVQEDIPRRMVGAFDVAVGLYGALSYADRPAKALAFAYDALESGGRMFLQVYGDRRRARTEALDLLMLKDARFYTANEIAAYVLSAGFHDVQVVGMSAMGHRLPERATQGTLNAYLWAEHRIFGRRFPDWCPWLVVTGRKP